MAMKQGWQVVNPLVVVLLCLASIRHAQSVESTKVSEVSAYDGISPVPEASSLDDSNFLDEDLSIGAIQPGPELTEPLGPTLRAVLGGRVRRSSCKKPKSKSPKRPKRKNKKRLGDRLRDAAKRLGGIIRRIPIRRG